MTPGKPETKTSDLDPAIGPGLIRYGPWPRGDLLLGDVHQLRLLLNIANHPRRFFTRSSGKNTFGWGE